MQKELLITLEEEAIFSTRMQTGNGHKTLHYIPGSALLGYCAARMYPQLDQKTNWLLFHSGKMRFLDGLPVSGQRPGYPMPLSLHGIKDRDIKLEDTFNLIWSRPAPHIQTEQMRNGHLQLDAATVIKAKTQFRMKTAIDPEKGTAADQQLFGYESLSAGQQFLVRIEADDESIDEGIFGQLLALLKGTCYLGRSRAAEFGRVYIEHLDTDVWQPACSSVASIQDNMLTLWAISDLALTTEEGFATTCPARGLSRYLPEDAQLVMDKTFIRHRDYSPWNAHRKAFEPERHLIQRGSVICFQLTSGNPLTESHLSRLQKGVGHYRHQGLGRLCINPTLLQGEKPVFTGKAASIPAQNEARTAVPDEDALVAWMMGRNHRQKISQDLVVPAQKFANDVYEMYQSAARYNASDLALSGPSSSQWGGAYQLSRSQENLDNLINTLFDENKGLLRGTMPGWNVRVYHNGKNISFSQWTRDQLEGLFPERNAVQDKDENIDIDNRRAMALVRKALSETRDIIKREVSA